METVIKVKSKIDDFEAIQNYLRNGLKEEEKRIRFAIERTKKRLLEYEKKFKKKSAQFTDEFKKGLIDETPETFDWWAESKLLNELQIALNTLNSIELCQE